MDLQILSSPVFIIACGIARFKRIYPSAFPTKRLFPPSKSTPALFAKNPGRSFTSGNTADKSTQAR